MMTKWIILSPFLLAATFLGVGLVATSLDTEGKDIQQLAERRYRAEARSLFEGSMMTATQDLAVQRYQSGVCVYAGNGVELQEGQVYQLAANTCVADGYGRTGLIGSNGAVGQLATTQDRPVIQQFLGW
jgi:hypothetical protein